MRLEEPLCNIATSAVPASKCRQSASAATSSGGGGVDREGTRAIVQRALDVGINFFDTADSYGNRGGSEEFLGDALAGQWDRVVLATKVQSRMGDGPNDSGASRYHILSGVEASL